MTPSLNAAEAAANIVPIRTEVDASAPPMQVIRRNGKVTPFDANKIAIAVSRTVRDEADGRRRSAVEGEDPDAVVVGVRGRRILAMPKSAESGEVHRWALRMTSPDQVRESYVVLGNIYGHVIDGGEEAEEGDVDRLRRMYDDGILHGNGWPVRSKVTGGIGFLAVDEMPQGGLTSETIDEFERAYGLVPQAALNWDGEGRDFVVCFVPALRLDDAAVVIDALNAIAAPLPKP